MSSKYRKKPKCYSILTKLGKPLPYRPGFVQGGTVMLKHFPQTVATRLEAPCGLKHHCMTLVQHEELP